MDLELNIMQGDSYGLPITIEMAEGVATPEHISDLEVVIGCLKKTYASGEISYNSDDGTFVFPLTQDETFKLDKGYQRVQIRIKFKSNDVVGQVLDSAKVVLSTSKEVL